MKLQVEGLRLAYADGTCAVENLDLEVEEGESLVLLGQSGCGKTSTMRCIAGLEEPGRGRILLDDRPVFDAAAGINVPPNKRNVGMVFQSYAVWPHRTVFQNVAFPLRMQKLGKRDVQQRVTEILDLVGLSHLADRGASQLSGGQMQRVALSRSLVMRPSVLMLDEPLSNLDARLRDRLRLELRDLQQRLGLTCIYVTHDQTEAFTLGDRIAMMQGGRIVQCATPPNLYAAPASASIADFLGVSNIFPVDAVRQGTDGTVEIRLSGSGLAVIACADASERDATGLRVCIRPEDLQVHGVEPDPQAFRGANVWKARVSVAGFQGSDVRYAVDLEGGPRLDVLSRAAGGVAPAGSQVWVSSMPASVQVLPEEVAR